MSANAHTANSAKCIVQVGIGHASMQSSLWPAATCCSCTATRSGCSTAPRSTAQPQDMHCQPSLPSRQAHNAVACTLFKVHRLNLVTLHCDNAVCHQLSHESSSRPIMSGQSLPFWKVSHDYLLYKRAFQVDVCKTSFSVAIDVSSDMQCALQCTLINLNLGPRCTFCHHCQQAVSSVSRQIPIFNRLTTHPLSFRLAAHPITSMSP